jgi:hypothetical protein
MNEEAVRIAWRDTWRAQPFVRELRGPVLRRQASGQNTASVVSFSHQ